MLSYLDIPEPGWLNGPPEPNPREFVGTCKNCGADRYDPNGDPIETSSCSCATTQCCDVCPRCSQCSEHVCPQCSVTFTLKGKEELVCSACHQTYLDDLTEVTPPKRNAHVDPVMAGILDAFADGLRSQLGGRS